MKKSEKHKLCLGQNEATLSSNSVLMEFFKGELDITAVTIFLHVLFK